MESLKENKILEYKPDTLQYLRNQYGFDTVKRVDEAIDILQEWAAKQAHFEKKTFDREYLERVLIGNKGSVERAKKKLDKLCTLRTLVPECFSLEKIDKELFYGAFSDAVLRQMTPDYGRVHLMQVHSKTFETQTTTAYMQYFVLFYNYMQMKDYSNHYTLIVHWNNANILEFIKATDVFDFHKKAALAYTGLSLRIKAVIHVTDSKAIEMFIPILKTVLGAKLGERIQVHKTMDTVYDIIPREIFPEEYGGNDKPLSELRDELYNELYSDEFTEYRREMNKARTNEALRPKDTFNEEYMGMSGTFRNLSVD